MHQVPACRDLGTQVPPGTGGGGGGDSGGGGGYSESCSSLGLMMPGL